MSRVATGPARPVTPPVHARALGGSVICFKPIP